jgi:FADH2-dependent halogenase
VGDAAGFIDPIFSSGVMLAMNSGAAGARAVDQAITTGQSMTAGMRAYEKQVWRNIGVFWKFIEKFYDHNFTQLFFQPVNRFRMVCAINCVLAGRTKLPFDIRWRLGVFFFLVRLNRLIPVVPRIRVG